MAEVVSLRPYQSQAIEELYAWFPKHEGNPCIVLPTGAGKSVILAAFCKKAISDFPETRILMCTHQKELIEQDYGKICELAPELDVGIYSAGIGRREADKQVVFASIQSIYKHADEVGLVNLVIVDEAHLINSQDQGMYRSFIEDLKILNPRIRVIGLTATPYRLKHGMITDKPALFNEPLIEPVSIKQLQAWGFLCKLTSKWTDSHLDVSEVGLVAGEYNAKQLVAAVDKPGTNKDVVKEVIKRAEDRKAWLFFCSGVDHARHIRDLLREEGVIAEMVCGSTPDAERERILSGFKDGSITAVTNANVLTTGFDNPRIDLIVMLRPTMSPGLYCQMAGRGLRIHPEKKNCLILDFAGNVSKHGPITDVQPPKKGRKKQGGVAPSKVCPKCGEIIAFNSRVCPECGYEYPVQERKYQLDSMHDIEESQITLPVKYWNWTKTISKAGNAMIVIRYYFSNLSMDPVTEYLVMEGDSWAVDKAQSRLLFLCKLVGCSDASQYNCDWINRYGQKPVSVTFHKEGKYYRVDRVSFDLSKKREA